MNRSVERRRYPVGGTVPGLVIVGTFHHPERGLVRASAAPVVGAELRRRGLRVLEARQALETDPGQTGVLFTASYLDRHGQPVGFAAAADLDDSAALEAADDAVQLWSSIWRTRRVLLASTNRFCPGERRENELRKRSAGGVVVFPARGVPLAVRAEAAARGTDVLDATCPLVAATHAEALRLAQNDGQVVVIGRRGHAALPALLGQAEDQAVLVENVAEVPALSLDPERVSYVVQTGVRIEEAAPVIAALRARFPRIRGAHPDSFCYAASDHTHTIRAVASSCDLVLVLGDSDTAELAALATGCGVPARMLGHVGELRADWLSGAACIGLAMAKSARPGLDAQVIDVLSGLGPLSVAHRRVSTETVSDQYGRMHLPTARKASTA
jgi:4-hydroxy-3-methylbut-2-enyl diphosphate reductase